RITYLCGGGRKRCAKHNVPRIIPGEPNKEWVVQSRSSKYTSIPSPGWACVALSNFLLTGKNCVPSPHGRNVVWKAMPFMVPLTLTGLVEPKKATDPGQLTHAQLPRTSMVAVKVF